MTRPDSGEMVASLHARYRAQVHGYVTRLLTDRQLAEDVVQETMLRAWRHGTQLRADQGSVRGWLMTVARNIAMDTLRMRRSRPPEVPADTLAGAIAAGDHADAVVTSLQVRLALARLSPRHRTVLEEIYFNGYTTREAAARLGIPEGTVFSRTHYALAILRRELADTPPGAGAARPRPAASGRGEFRIPGRPGRTAEFLSSSSPRSSTGIAADEPGDAARG